VTLSPDGSILVHTSIFEPGTGTYTLLQKIVSEELNVPLSQVRVEVWDTDAVPFDTGVGGSRVTRVAGLAAIEAAGEAASELLRVAADILGWPEERMKISGVNIVRQDTSESHPWAELLDRYGRPVVGRGHVVEGRTAEVSSFTAQVAEVSVDRETGEVTVLRFTTAHDVGTVLNPVDHQGQIDGAVIQGIGYALTENLEVEEGRVTVPNFGEYKILNIKDIPELRTILLETDSGPGPYHARGIGENPCGPVAPAIANAIADAVGVRIKDLPITAEKINRALAQR